MAPALEGLSAGYSNTEYFFFAVPLGVGKRFLAILFTAEFASGIQIWMFGNIHRNSLTLLFAESWHLIYYHWWRPLELLRRCIVVLLLSAYGSPSSYVEVPIGTPPLLDEKQRISRMRYTSQEWDFYLPQRRHTIWLEGHVNLDQTHRISFRLVLSCQYLLTISGGHAGALSGLVDVIRDDTVCRMWKYILILFRLSKN